MKITLKAARVNAGMSQDDVANAMHKSNKTIGLWENGKADIDFANFDMLCKLYKVEKDNIILPITLGKTEQEKGETE